MYIGLESRTERPRKINIGKEVANVTCDSDTTFKVKRSKVKVTRPLYSTRKVAAAVSVGTYSAWESTATLRLLGGATQLYSNVYVSDRIKVLPSNECR